MANQTSKRKSQQRQAILQLVIMAAILVCVNIIAAKFHYGLDLTTEKRFTLSAPTKKLLKKMDDVAVVTVYLKGSFPTGFQRLAEATRERLQSFKDVSGNKIIFKFTDPFEGKTEEEKGPIYQELSKKGIEPINIKRKTEEEGYNEKYIFPYALVQYKGKEISVRLLENNVGYDEYQNLTASETLLEFKFASAIHKLDEPAPADVAYIVGHGETLGWPTYDLLMTLSRKYNVDTFDMASNYFIPRYYKAIIINKPTLPFEDKEKFKIDQYVMNGGKVLWAIDQLYTPMDSLNNGSQAFVATDYGLGLDDLLFKWGVRINTDIVEDMQCLPLPIIVGQQGDKPQMDLRPWIYFPLFMPTSDHPIVKNLNVIMSRFANSIDTIAVPDVNKTILIQSSQYSRTEQYPVRVSLGMLKYPFTPDMFKKPYRPTAVLLEGKFKSIFQNRLAPQFLQVLKDSLKQTYKEQSDSSTSMIVISDGDLMENDFTQQYGPMEMGYWRFTRTRYSNKEFVLNCMDYLTDNSGLLEARAKDQVIRMLDAKRVTKEKVKWRVINIGLPILIILVFASAYIFFRKRRYEKA
ncbi:MAG: gliding motility-associated ABC transporter substrate-binding protein GldG [Bacteroidetes bacterium]|nr:gliding motility-associated ABC transporter substrate-binding protein GldG [Bacteroidota bacterium]